MAISGHRNKASLRNYSKEKRSRIFKGPFSAGDKVEDYCHFTGKYRGAAYAKCNLVCKVQTFFQSSFTSYLVMILISSVRNLERVKEKSNAFQKSKDQSAL